MTVPYVLGWDATSANVSSAPVDQQAALYVTGTGSIPATSAQLAQFPNALRIAQWPGISADEAAIPDYLDLENGAIVLTDLSALIPYLVSTFHNVTRPGQRWPAIYCGDNASPTQVANFLDANGMSTAGVGLVLVRWGLTEAEAAALLSYPATVNNPFPVVGVQFSDHGPNGEPYDRDVFATGWVDDRSKVNTPPPVTGTQNNWFWCSKCGALNHNPPSVCPAGGSHNNTQSYNYSLSYTKAG